MLHVLSIRFSFSIPTPGFPHFYYMLGANLGLLLYGEVSLMLYLKNIWQEPKISEGNLKINFCWVTYIHPHKAVTRDTISRWIKLVMTTSGINTNVYGSHSVRSASTSKAKLKMVPVADILQKAGWSRQSTVTKFYDREINESDTFEEAVLQQDC